jgi:hypothetical protein
MAFTVGYHSQTELDIKYSLPPSVTQDLWFGGLR